MDSHRRWLSAIQVATRGHPGRPDAGRPEIQSQGDASVHALQRAGPRAALLGRGTHASDGYFAARTSPLIIRCAKPSTIAVLPTPGSPISTGLFLVRRCNT